MEFLYYLEFVYWFVILRIREWKMKGKISYILFCLVIIGNFNIWGKRLLK